MRLSVTEIATKVNRRWRNHRRAYLGAKSVWGVDPALGKPRDDMGVPSFVDDLRLQGYPVITIDKDYGLSMVQPVKGGNSLKAPSAAQ
jgi:hypothetical protein